MKPLFISKIVFLSVLLAVLFSSCSSKEDDTIKPIYPLTALPGSTWTTHWFTSTVDKTEFYQFIYFKSDTEVQIWTAKKDGSGILGEKDYHPVIIKKYDSNMDSFEIFYLKTGKSGIGFTGPDVNTITYGSDDYSRFK